MNLLIDNYDSFSYNLYQYVGEIDPHVRVIRNDELSVEEILALQPESVIISPGPGRPADAGICEELVAQVAEHSRHLPILGVCLGHQAICEALGGCVGYAEKVMHGKATAMKILRPSPLFAGLSSSISVARYHSLAAKAQGLPESLQVTGIAADDGEIMAVEHRSLQIYGLQFHPESILTEHGKTIIKNFMNTVTTVSEDTK